MTNKHPITPPPELVERWVDMLSSRSDQVVFTMAAQWGSDQELEACCELMDDWGLDEADLRAARRPKPPSLKEEALLVIDTAVNNYHMSSDAASIIRRALEALPE